MAPHAGTAGSSRIGASGGARAVLVLACAQVLAHVEGEVGDREEGERKRTRCRGLVAWIAGDIKASTLATQGDGDRRYVSSSATSLPRSRRVVSISIAPSPAWAATARTASAAASTVESTAGAPALT